ncbi:MAG: Riboflavin biosynthesis protein [Hydrocarboniphaga sp.]|uniref:bifunctional riboflavin kinase/FAD synthetase n=1 Tax=Hydrocarboniphaga sp. TaxID=2033016 RepID=UPI00260993AA|nr:bifunctional riboflavin kinase/FAD synthetase [Hydrocarboniphaga sp.]MDB5968812.1 Riboflavin biosynthesis protein [Hydrocarboniphaga sp.]
MELIRGLQNLRDSHRGCVLTIGNFDGMHLGHRALVARTLDGARRTGLPATALTFEPSPREYFSPADAPPRVQTFRTKIAALAGSGLQRTVVARFSKAVASMSADEFVDQLLVKTLGVGAVVVGDDFRYGSHRAGTVQTLRDAAEHHGFELGVVDKVCVGNERCSSTALREALSVSDLARAARLLGRPYSVLGRVRRGLQLGRTLGMPTANIDLFRPLALRQGVYAVRCRVDRGTVWDGVASLGIRPTLGLTRCLLEAHLFGEPGDLYGHELIVEFCAWLRPELKFSSLDELSARMQQDADDARRILALSMHKTTEPT